MLSGELDNQGDANTNVFLGGGNDTMTLALTADDFTLDSSAGNNRITILGNVGAATAATFTNTITLALVLTHLISGCRHEDCHQDGWR